MHVFRRRGMDHRGCGVAMKFSGPPERVLRADRFNRRFEVNRGAQRY